MTYVFGEEESEKTVTWNDHKTKALPFRSKIRLLKVGAALGSMTSSESFKIGTTSLKTDYDANVFAKKSVSAGNLTDGDGNVIVTVPFAAARVVVDKNTGVIDVYDSAKQYGALEVALNMINIALLLSVNLGIMNLLPLPALDGGRLVFLLVEAIRGKPIPPEKEGMVHLAGMAALMVLMVLVLFNDITKFF